MLQTFFIDILKNIVVVVKKYLKIFLNQKVGNLILFLNGECFNFAIEKCYYASDLEVDSDVFLGKLEEVISS